MRVGDKVKLTIPLGRPRLRVTCREFQNQL